jgi:hypothetical protein
MSEKWLLMRCSSELDSILAVARCPEGFIENVEGKRAAIEQLSKCSPHDTLSQASYWYGIEAYEMPDMESILDDELLEIFEERNWVTVDSEPNLDEAEDVRARGCELCLPVIGNYFCWTFYPKHSNITYETPCISPSDFREQRSTMNNERSRSRVVALFKPQADFNGYCIDIDGAYTFDVTDQIKAMGRKSALEIKDDEYSSDELWHTFVKRNPDKDHNGPFRVIVEEAIENYFKEQE